MVEVLEALEAWILSFSLIVKTVSPSTVVYFLTFHSLKHQELVIAISPHVFLNEKPVKIKSIITV